MLCQGAVTAVPSPRMQTSLPANQQHYNSRKILINTTQYDHKYHLSISHKLL